LTGTIVRPALASAAHQTKNPRVTGGFLFPGRIDVTAYTVPTRNEAEALAAALKFAFPDLAVSVFASVVLAGHFDVGWTHRGRYSTIIESAAMYFARGWFTRAALDQEAKVEHRIEIRCPACDKAEVFAVTGLCDASARDLAEIYDGTSKSYVVSPRSDPNSTIGKCTTCRGNVDARVLPAGPPVADSEGPH
jgi:hypothetical protein